MLRSVGTRMQSALVEAWHRLESKESLDLVAPLTLVLLLLYPVGHPDVTVLLQLGAVAGLVYRPLQRVSGYWMLLAAGMATGCLLLWHDADNHKYLITYWCLALGLSCMADDREKALRINARLLLGTLLLDRCDVEAPHARLSHGRVLSVCDAHGRPSLQRGAVG